MMIQIPLLLSFAGTIKIKQNKPNNTQSTNSKWNRAVWVLPVLLPGKHNKVQKLLWAVEEYFQWRLYTSKGLIQGVHSEPFRENLKNTWLTPFFRK